MEESQEILLRSLQSFGVLIPPNVSSIQDLTPPSLVSICAQALHLIDAASPIPTSLPDSPADRFKICAQLASALTDLGFVGGMSFHKQFLYPSEDDLYKLVRFLVERLSKSFEAADQNDINARIGKGEKPAPKNWMEKTEYQGVDYEKLRVTLKDLRLKTDLLDPLNLNSTNASVSGPNEALPVLPKTDQQGFVNIFQSSPPDSSSKEALASVDDDKQWTEETQDLIKRGSGNDETAAQRDDIQALELQQKLISLKERSSKVINEIEESRGLEKLLVEEATTKSLELQNLEEEHEIMKTAVGMAFNDQHPVDFYLRQHTEKVDERRQGLEELESQSIATLQSLEEKRRNLEESLYATCPEAEEKLQKLKEAEMETQSILSETRKREEEHDKLLADLEKQPKLAPRRSYIQRITEITKNSRKQEADIERILRETRELQLESNSVQERLHRTYAVVDESVYREAKKDPVGRQAYRLLTSIHEAFEQISEKTLATDRIRREVAEHERKLAAMGSRSLDIDKLQADLDAIKKENEYLEKQLEDT